MITLSHMLRLERTLGNITQIMINMKAQRVDVYTALHQIDNALYWSIYEHAPQIINAEFRVIKEEPCKALVLWRPNDERAA